MARTIGIDIGSFSIKVAELEGHVKTTTVRDFYEFPLNHEPGQDVRLEKLEALKKIAATYDPRQFKFVVGLGSEYSTSRILNFPFLERRKILQSLPFELEDVIPFSQQDAIFDFRIIHQKPNSSQVLAIAVPKKYIQELLILCEDAGISPDIVSLDGVALCNHFENFLAPPPQLEAEATVVAQTQLVVHIGYTKTLLDVIQNRSLLATRALYFGGRDITNAVSRAYQLPYLEALKGVTEKGFVLTSNEGADEDQVTFSNVISQSLNMLVADLKRTVVDLRAELQCEFTSVRLMGGMSRIINLGPYLTQRLEIPVEVFPHLGKTTRSDIPVNDANDKASAVAIGLAIEGLRKPRSPAVNLRKNEFSKQSQALQYMVDQYKDVAKMAALFLVVFFIYSSLRSTFAETNLEAVQKVIKDQAKNPVLALTTKELKPESLKKVIKNKRQEIESKKQVARLNQMNSALDVIQTISTSLPGKPKLTLDVLHLNIDGDRMTIQGTVASKSELDTVQRSLSQLPMITSVTMGQPRPVVNGRLPFSLTASLMRVPHAEKKGP